MNTSSSRVQPDGGWSFCGAQEAQYHDTVECDAWEVVVPELVFELDEQVSRGGGAPPDAGHSATGAAGSR